MKNYDLPTVKRTKPRSVRAASPETIVKGEDCPCLPECPARRQGRRPFYVALRHVPIVPIAIGIGTALCDIKKSCETQVN
jgi:hypothetical protein